MLWYITKVCCFSWKIFSSYVKYIFPQFESQPLMSDNLLILTGADNVDIFHQRERFICWYFWWYISYSGEFFNIFVNHSFHQRERYVERKSSFKIFEEVWEICCKSWENSFPNIQKCLNWFQNFQTLKLELILQTSTVVMWNIERIIFSIERIIFSICLILSSSNTYWLALLVCSPISKVTKLLNFYQKYLWLLFF